jgi:molybdenum cofactor guanylyltransferase
MTAVVLAGGRGSRMKADKAGLVVRGRPLLEHVLAQLEPLFDEVLVSVSPGQKVVTKRAWAEPSGTRRKEPAKDDGRSRSATRRENRSPRVVVDEVPGLGPLGGIIAGLKAATHEACAVVACDIPDIDAALLRRLARAAASAEIAVPGTRRAGTSRSSPSTRGRSSPPSRPSSGPESAAFSRSMIAAERPSSTSRRAGG